MIERVFEAVGSLGGPWAYLAVSLLAAGESSLGVGLVVPGETGMIVGGFVVSQGNAHLGIMIAVAVVGAVVGDSIGYEIGRRFGPRLRRTRIGKTIGETRWRQAEAYLAQRGGRAVFAGRFVAVVRSLVPALAGAGGMPYRRFLLWNALGGVVWGSTFVTLGWVAGRSYEQVAENVEDAGLIVLGLLVTVGAIVLAARWVVRHPAEVRALGDRVASWRPVVWFGRHFGGLTRFVQGRFRIDDPFGLSLTLGLVFLIPTAWFLAELVSDVQARADIVRIDDPVTSYLAEHREAWLSDSMRAVTQLGSWRVLIPGAAVIGVIWLVRTRRWGVLVFLALALGGGALASDVLKTLVERPRPGPEYAIVGADGWAFPSGHATAATVTWGALAYLHGSVVRPWALRVSVWAVASGVIVLVAFSRVYLGVHWVTDVVGGILLGAAWLGVVVIAFGTSGRYLRRYVSGTDAKTFAGPEPVAGRDDDSSLMIDAGQTNSASSPPP